MRGTVPGIRALPCATGASCMPVAPSQKKGRPDPRQHGQLPAQGRAAQADAVTPVIGEEQQGRDAKAQQRQRLRRQLLLGAQAQGEKETGPEQHGGEGGGPAAATG
ncbi:hypothetical protein [Aeromonas taiwanensis]|uniref:hypothetical protein n=1 Tax=Aeromonas taiwanensis TaxID=633417 RepID=UPI001F24FA7F|nr:hypothetical protein [Aeromonas taiwanensis]